MKREPRTARAFQLVSDSKPTFSTKSLSESSIAQDIHYPEKYKSFESIDGTHPWATHVPDGCLLYPVRELKEGKVTFFNFDLAREMGLISQNHPNELTKDLEKILLKTFAIRIVNEYDQKLSHKLTGVKKNLHMATRYLQLQHADKTGRTSGDGRSIWNGTVTHAGKTWDVSSRGTGVTRLAPGAVEAGKPLRTGTTQFGYGCGLADVDELYGTAIMSEIFHRQNISTERVLCIIDIGRKQGIGVRAHQNLVRPAHLFAFLKQGDYKNLRRAVDYFIQRQISNKEWEIPRGQGRYAAMCERVAIAFAKLAARLDVDYIFVWLDWDGDNILANGGIIDYGSVRQFGLRHDQYRYDDVDRFSTNLNEQRLKARQIVQTFLQMADFLRTGRRKTLGEFANHSVLGLFDEIFEESKREQLAYRMGFAKAECEKLLTRYPYLFEEFYRDFQYFEKVKTKKPVEKVADGVNKPAIFNMRDLLRELPQLLIASDGAPLDAEYLFQLILSSFAKGDDKKMSKAQGDRLMRLQITYLELIDVLRGRRERERFMRGIAARSAIINRSDRITGNSITVVVDELMAKIKSGLSPVEIQAAMDSFVQTQVLVPDGSSRGRHKVLERPKTRSLMKTFLRVVEDLREDI